MPVSAYPILWPYLPLPLIEIQGPKEESDETAGRSYPLGTEDKNLCGGAK